MDDLYGTGSMTALRIFFELHLFRADSVLLLKTLVGYIGRRCDEQAGGKDENVSISSLPLDETNTEL